MNTNRRRILTGLAGTALTPLISRSARAQQAISALPAERDWSGQNPVRYPDPDIIALDDRFRRYVLFNTPMLRLHTGKLWDVNGTRLHTGRQFARLVQPDGASSAADGIRCDADGNIWAGARPGVQVIAPDGDTIGLIRLPEVCANVCFGGAKRHRLFMTASQSLYAVYVGVTGAHIC